MCNTSYLVQQDKIDKMKKIQKLIVDGYLRKMGRIFNIYLDINQTKRLNKLIVDGFIASSEQEIKISIPFPLKVLIVIFSEEKHLKHIDCLIYQYYSYCLEL